MWLIGIIVGAWLWLLLGAVVMVLVIEREPKPTTVPQLIAQVLFGPIALMITIVALPFIIISVLVEEIDESN